MTFTGSVGTGRRVADASVKVMRKFQLEMGGKNPLVVLDDADLDVAVEMRAPTAPSSPPASAAPPPRG